MLLTAPPTMPPSHSPCCVRGALPSAASAPRETTATNKFTTAGAARQPGQPARPKPHASLCQHRSATGSPP